MNDRDTGIEDQSHPECRLRELLLTCNRQSIASSMVLQGTDVPATCPDSAGNSQERENSDGAHFDACDAFKVSSSNKSFCSSALERFNQSSVEQHCRGHSLIRAWNLKCKLLAAGPSEGSVDGHNECLAACTSFKEG